MHALVLCSLLIVANAAPGTSTSEPTKPRTRTKAKPAPAPPPVEVAPAPPPPKPAPSSEPVKLATTGISVVNLPASFGGFYSEHAAQELNGWGFRVITSREVTSLLGFERQKQLMGCSDESSSCMAELANALGVDGLLLGDIAKFGGVYQVNLKVIAAGSGKILATYSERVGSEEALLDVFSRGAEQIAKTVATALNRTPPVRVTVPMRVDVSSRPASFERPMRKYSWIPATAAVAGTVTGVVLWTSARSAAAQLTSPTTPLTLDQAAALRDSGSRSQTWALVSFGVSAAALATAATMFFRTSEEAVVVTPVASVNGAAFVVSGRFL